MVFWRSLIVLLSHGVVLANGKINPVEVKAVACEVCKIAVTEAMASKVTEETVDDLCEPKVKEGRWLAAIDITDNPNRTLSVTRMPGFGKCQTECSVAARACRKAINDNDKLLSLIQAQKKATTIQDTICKKACKNGDVVVHRENDEKYVEIDQKLAEMEDMMKDMKQKTGMGMKMYSRDDFASMSEGDMETMAAREMLAQERAEDRYRQQGDQAMQHDL